ncbi:MAG: hypothetical protein JSS09_04625, partial [Verrucomicrobia bacterium]|nr:hypothetical protein [Verrucomicrobiota bacterium]
MKVIFFKIAALLMCCISSCRADLVEDVARYSLQQDHPFHDVLNRIFASSKTLDSKTDLINAGFSIIDFRIPDFVIASHPDLPGHLVKVHLHSSGRLIEHRWRNLIKRCEAAERLRDLIQKEKLRYFT